MEGKLYIKNSCLLLYSASLHILWNHYPLLCDGSTVVSTNSAHLENDIISWQTAQM